MIPNVNFYADFGKLTELQGAAQKHDPKALREAARQFESVFMRMMLKSMRQANLTGSSENSLMDSQQTDFYRDMYDNQLAMLLSRGKGLGLADLLVKQLATDRGVAANAAAQSKSQVKSQVKSQSTVTQTFAVPPRTAQPAVGAPNNLPTASVSAPATPAPTPVAPMESAQGTVAVADAHAVSVDQQADVTFDGTPADFVQKMWPYAADAAQKLGVDPCTLIAHAALETGWGKYIPSSADGSCSYNMFGIKAGGKWDGPSVGIRTLEYEDGTAVSRRAQFRAYASPADSFRDYAAFLKNSPRYTDALGVGSDAAAFGAALQRGGYATDPNYANKLAATAASLRVLARHAEFNSTRNAALNNESSRPLTTGRGATV